VKTMNICNRQPFSTPVRIGILLFILGAAIPPVHAHNPGFSSATVYLSNDVILVNLTYNTLDLQSLLAESPDANAVAASMLEVSLSEKLLAPSRIQLNKDSAGEYQFLLTYKRTGGTRLKFRNRSFESLPLGHRQVLTVQDASGKKDLDQILSERTDSASLELPGAPLSPRTSASETPRDLSIASPAQIQHGIALNKHGVIAASLLLLSLLGLIRLNKTRALCRK